MDDAAIVHRLSSIVNRTSNGIPRSCASALPIGAMLYDADTGTLHQSLGFRVIGTHPILKASAHYRVNGS
jgi:hypothetical protein